MTDRSFPALRSSVAAARRFTEETLRELDGERLESIVIMVSEPAANSVLHADSPFRVSIRRSANAVLVEISDLGGGDSVLRPLRPVEPSGRGLRFVDALADDWGVTKHIGGPGKTVWFSLG